MHRSAVWWFAALALLAGCVDASVLTGFECDADGRCAVTKDGGRPDGASCGAASACASGFCVAGVCCNSACGGACETCSAAASPGQCAPRPAGEACGDYLCDGVRGACPAACTTSTQCASGRGCRSSPGVLLCSCSPNTGGGPAVCAPPVTDLGKAQATTSRVSVTLTQAVDAGVGVVVLGTSAAPFTVSDTQGNAWTRVAVSGTCASCGVASLYQSTLTTALQPGDKISLQGSSSTTSALWAFTSRDYPYLDQVGTLYTGATTSMPLVSTSLAVTQPDELVVGAVGIGDSATLVPEGFVSELDYATTGSSGVIAARLGTGLAGVQSLSVSSSKAGRFSGVIATFSGVAPVAPSALVLRHVDNAQGFSVSWTAGLGHGGASGCTLQSATSAAAWTTLAQVNCDATTTDLMVTLPADGWYGAPWSSVEVRLARAADGTALATFPQALGCVALASSNTTTPTIDENCDGRWDEHTCASWAWVAGQTYSAPANTACADSPGAAASFACVGTAEGVVRYTDGLGSTATPATSWSSDAVGTTCTGSFTGAQAWTCTGATCTFN